MYGRITAKKALSVLSQKFSGPTLKSIPCVAAAVSGSNNQNGIIMRGYKTFSLLKDSQKSNKEATSVSSDEEYYQMRKDELKEFQQKYPSVLPTIYPNHFPLTCNIKEYKQKYDHLQPSEKLKDVEEFIAGRIISKRKASSKLYFYTIRSNNDHSLHQVQIMTSSENYNETNRTSDESNFVVINTVLRKGDIVGVKGFPAKSGKGELSIIPTEITLLSPCLHQLPHKISYS